MLDSPYTAAISQGVIRLIEKGVLARLKKKWWEEQRGGGSCTVRGRNVNPLFSSDNCPIFFIRHNMSQIYMEMFQDAGGASGDQMSVAALAGLYMMLIAGIAFAAIIAICEFTWRKRKLAVDENVSSGSLDTWERLSRLQSFK